MLAVMKIVQLIIIAPAVIKLVMNLVQAFEGKGSGEDKKQAVMDSVKMVYDTSSGFFPIKVPYSFIESLASATIDLVVDFYNMIGHFKHEKKIEETPVEPAPTQENPIVEPQPEPIQETPPVEAQPVQEIPPAEVQPEPVQEPEQSITQP